MGQVEYYLLAVQLFPGQPRGGACFYATNANEAIFWLASPFAEDPQLKQVNIQAILEGTDQAYPYYQDMRESDGMGRFFGSLTSLKKGLVDIFSQHVAQSNCHQTTG